MNPLDPLKIKDISGHYFLDRSEIQHNPPAFFKIYKSVFACVMDDESLRKIETTIYGTDTLNLVKEIFKDTNAAVLNLKHGNPGMEFFCKLKIISSPDKEIQFTETIK